MSDGRIRREPGESVGAATLQTQTQMREWRRRARGLIGFDQAKKCPPDGLRKHGRFGAALLLLQDNHGLVEIRIALFDLRTQDSNLRVLATQAEDCSSRHVGMVDVSRN